MADAIDQEIADFADHLVPEAFSTASTAYRVDLLGPPGPDGFAGWIQRCRADAIAARYPVGGTPSGVVYVRRGDERWRWDQEPCCELEWLTGRVSDEIAAFGQPWVFVCSLRDRGRALDHAGETADPHAVTWGLPWYAEARSDTVARVLDGIDEVRGSEVTGRQPLPHRSPFKRSARRVLFRHPSRRAYRLR